MLNLLTKTVFVLEAMVFLVLLFLFLMSVMEKDFFGIVVFVIFMVINYFVGRKIRKIIAKVNKEEKNKKQFNKYIDEN